MQLNGSQIFVEVLCEQGVDTLFGYPGGAVLNLYDELYKNSDRITHVLTAHEQGAAHAADGYARATGRTGVVLATSRVPPAPDPPAWGQWPPAEREPCFPESSPPGSAVPFPIPGTDTPIPPGSPDSVPRQTVPSPG